MHSIVCLVAAAASCGAQARSAGHSERGLAADVEGKELVTTVASAAGSQVTVSKTAHVEGENVCGVISITNGTGQPASVASIADTLEVHFAYAAPPGALSAGSTRNWFKVADLPMPLPGPITPRTTTTIDYCFPLCLAADFAGANSMRNVVRLDIVEPSGRIKTFTTRSTSFAPPTLDCQACCTGDGTCTDTVRDNCITTGGLPQGVGTNCATSECPEACCHADGTCTDTAPTACEAAAGQPGGAGTNCATTECCRPLGTACNNGVPCCGENAFCTSGTCCIGLADSGCASIT